MAFVAMTGNDTISVNGRILIGLATGDCVKITYPNDIANVKTGKNGNSIYSLNESGKQAKLELHLIRGCDDDKYMLNRLNQQNANFSGTVLINGEFVKKIGDGTGNVAGDTYLTSGGVFTKPVEVTMNVDGSAEQSIAIYNIMFSNAPRVIT